MLTDWTLVDVEIACILALSISTTVLYAERLEQYVSAAMQQHRARCFDCQLRALLRDSRTVETPTLRRPVRHHPMGATPFPECVAPIGSPALVAAAGSGLAAATSLQRPGRDGLKQGEAARKSVGAAVRDTAAPATNWWGRDV